MLISLQAKQNFPPKKQDFPAFLIYLLYLKLIYISWQGACQFANFFPGLMTSTIHVLSQLTELYIILVIYIIILTPFKMKTFKLLMLN